MIIDQQNHNNASHILDLVAEFGQHWRLPFPVPHCGHSIWWKNGWTIVSEFWITYLTSVLVSFQNFCIFFKFTLFHITVCKVVYLPLTFYVKSILVYKKPPNIFILSLILLIIVNLCHFFTVEIDQACFHVKSECQKNA